MNSAQTTNFIAFTNRTDWTRAGVVGGIRTYSNISNVTAAPWNVSTSGGDLSSALTSLEAIAPSNTVIYIPAGNYRMTSGVTMTAGKAGVVIRGDGPTTIITNESSSQLFTFGQDTSTSAAQTIISGADKGSSNVVVSSTTDFTVGALALIEFRNDTDIPVVSVYGYDWQRCEYVTVTAKDSSSVTFWPPLVDTYYTEGRIKGHNSAIRFCGIEDLAIVRTNSSTVIKFQQARDCWMKDVSISNTVSYFVWTDNSVNLSIAGCDFGTATSVGPGGAGIRVTKTCHSLIENNSIYKAFPHIEVLNGCVGNVFGYNFLVQATDSGSYAQSLISNHGGHNSFNLYEGNVMANLQCDGYFAGASSDTLHRNWLFGGAFGVATNLHGISLNRFTRAYQLIGNIVSRIGSYGNPNLGNDAFIGEGPPWSTNTFAGAGTLSQSGTTVTTTLSNFNANMVGWWIAPTPNDYGIAQITTYTATNEVETAAVSRSLSGITVFNIGPGTGGYQERDMGVTNTSNLRGNWYNVEQSIPTVESMGSTNLSDSLYLSGQPSWWTSGLTWPAIVPTSPRLTNFWELETVALIPAQVEYYNLSVDGAVSGTRGIPLNIRIRP